MNHRYFTNPEVVNAVKNWQRVSEQLESFRNEEIININVQESLESLAELFEDAILKTPLTKTSGLIEQQALFQKLRNEVTT